MRECRVWVGEIVELLAVKELVNRCRKLAPVVGSVLTRERKAQRPHAHRNAS
jgi:hypothetical protein